MAKADYYELLGVSKDADASTIKKAYRKLAIKFHPDKNPDDAAAEEKFKEIGEAYEILSSEDKRAAYDRYGHAAFEGGMGGGGGGGFHDASDIFSQVFGGAFGGSGGFEDFFGGGGGRGRSRGRASSKRPGSDLRYDLEISLEEAATGVEKELEIEKEATCGTCDGKGAKDSGGAKSCSTCRGQGVVARQSGIFVQQTTCPDCRGAGEVIANPCADCNGNGTTAETTRIKIRIPAGVDSGTRLRSSGNGDAGFRGGPSGDLYVFIHIEDHEVFEREGENLYCEVPMPFGIAALGGEMKVPTLEGKSSIKIPAGTQGGTVFRLRGKGIKDLSSGYKGDLHVEVKVEVPTKLNSEQKEKLAAFTESIGQKNSPLQESFLDKAKKFFDF